MMDWNWNGARWWKFDFHAHTPASEDYGKGTNQETFKARTPKDWLLDYMKAGIDCVAVTDHNTGEWIDQLKRALKELNDEDPADLRDLVVFPGVEISVHGGVHVLALFEPQATTADIEKLLGAVGFHGTRGKSDACTELPFAKVVAAIGKARGIAIPAHADGPRGVFKEQSGRTLDQALECPGVIAMELLDASSKKPQGYIDLNLNWTEVVGSDAHYPGGVAGEKHPGSHFTWVKMGKPNLEGLRLAILDGPLSVRRSDQESGDPNTHGALVIEKIEVKKARYMGQARTFSVTLNPWLNTVIGGRGTGKSTLVEFVRTALRRDQELPESWAKDFAKYRNAYASRTEEGLLTDDARFVVTYRKDGTRFRVQWSYGGDVEPIELYHEGSGWRGDPGDVAQRFPVRIYSQKQVFELAKAPLALLRIVDEAQEVDRRSWDDGWKEEETRFLSLRAKAREIDAGLADEPRLRGELEDVKRRLAVFEEAGHAAVLTQYQRRLRQQRQVEQWERSWAISGDRLRELAAELVPDALDESLFENDRPEDRKILAEAGASLERLEAVRRRLEELGREADSTLSDWSRDRVASPWEWAVVAALGEYKDLREKLAAEGAGDPSAYGELVQRRQVIEERLNDLQGRRRHLVSVRREADASLERLGTLRRELTRRRAEFLSKVLKDNAYVRIKLEAYGAALETAEPELRRLLQLETGVFEKDIGKVGKVGGEGLLGGLCANPVDANAAEEQLAKLKKRVKLIATGEHEAGGLHDRRFAAHVSKLPPEALDRIDRWFLEDSLHVQYSTTADGSGFRSIQEGSPGQKTAALLAFLLSYGKEPIILDQPEDDLDNHLIYDLIVTQLRNIKRDRQVIVVTHNANIVVNGDAELVVALEVRNGETHQECVGSLQDKTVRSTICAIMEGGREAFERRYRRIVLEGSHV